MCPMCFDLKVDKSTMTGNALDRGLRPLFVVQFRTYSDTDVHLPALRQTLLQHALHVAAHHGADVGFTQTRLQQAVDDLR